MGRSVHLVDLSHIYAKDFLCLQVILKERV